MKKTFLLVVAITLLFSSALAEPDRATYNIEESDYTTLLALMAYIQEQIVSREEWQEMEVPPGEWTVGIDIPVGAYSIRTKENTNYATFFIWGSAVNDYQTNGGLLKMLDLGEGEVYGKAVLKDGNVVVATDTTILAPPAAITFK